MENKEETKPATENTGSVENRLLQLEGRVYNLRTLLWVLVVIIAVVAYKLYPIVDAWDKIEALLH